MPTYRISVPINGIQLFQVDNVENEAEAFESILSGEADPVDAGAVDLDLDTHNWKCAELWSDDEGVGLNGPNNAPPRSKNAPESALSDLQQPSEAPDDSPGGAVDGAAASEGQRTFGPAVGLAPVVPVEKRTYDQRTCSDGVTRMHDDVFYDSRDNAHGTGEERHKADVAIVTEILMQEDEWIRAYTNGQCGNTDYIDGYRYIVGETDDSWPRSVKDWIQDNYDHTLEVDEELTSRICEALDLNDFEPEFNDREFRAYSGDGCCLNGWAIDEYENQIDIADHRELQVLHDQRRLDDILDDVNCDVIIHRRRKRTLVKDTGRYESTGRETYDPDSRWPDLLACHSPGGRWDWVVSADSMRRLYHAALVDYLRKTDSNG